MVWTIVITLSIFYCSLMLFKVKLFLDDHRLLLPYEPQPTADHQQ
jgi:hypothetical protein